MKTGSRKSASNRGFILISVILSVTLLLTTATAFAWYAKNELKRAAAETFIYQSRCAAETACAFAAEKIGADKNGYDSSTENLYLPAAGLSLSLGDYKVTMRITPLDDKISARGLFLPDGVTLRTEYTYAWSKIWQYLGRPELAALVLDFMDSDDRQKLGGAERESNINRPVADLSELRALPEIDDGVLYGTEKLPGGLAMFLSAYGGDKININVAAPEVIAVLDDKIDISQARRLAAVRIASPIKNIDDLKKVPGFPAAAITKLSNIIGFESTCFQTDIKVENANKQQRNFRVILQRSGQSCKILRWEE
jgi:type II secretory pathway component PulK